MLAVIFLSSYDLKNWEAFGLMKCSLEISRLWDFEEPEETEVAGIFWECRGKN
jgi:hypothetical protein